MKAKIKGYCLTWAVQTAEARSRVKSFKYKNIVIDKNGTGKQ